MKKESVLTATSSVNQERKMIIVRKRHFVDPHMQQWCNCCEFATKRRTGKKMACISSSTLSETKNVSSRIKWGENFPFYCKIILTLWTKRVFNVPILCWDLQSKPCWRQNRFRNNWKVNRYNHTHVSVNTSPFLHSQYQLTFDISFCITKNSILHSYISLKKRAKDNESGIV